MNRIDKLKERLTHFVKEGTSETSLKVPNRVICGFKLDNVAIVIQDLLCDKYHKNLRFVDYVEDGDGYIFNFKEAT
jgi:hypothetical protein